MLLKAVLVLLSCAAVARGAAHGSGVATSGSGHAHGHGDHGHTHGDDGHAHDSDGHAHDSDGHAHDNDDDGTPSADTCLNSAGVRAQFVKYALEQVSGGKFSTIEDYCGDQCAKAHNTGSGEDDENGSGADGSDSDGSGADGSGEDRRSARGAHIPACIADCVTDFHNAVENGRRGRRDQGAGGETTEGVSVAPPDCETLAGFDFSGCEQGPRLVVDAYIACGCPDDHDDDHGRHARAAHGAIDPSTLTCLEFPGGDRRLRRDAHGASDPCAAVCPTGTCDSPADASKPECFACAACLTNSDPCAAVCPTGTCDDTADTSKPECFACAACHATINGDDPCAPVCPTGTCDGPADASKPECTACAACLAASGIDDGAGDDITTAAGGGITTAAGGGITTAAADSNGSGGAAESSSSDDDGPPACLASQFAPGGAFAGVDVEAYGSTAEGCATLAKCIDTSPCSAQEKAVISAFLASDCGQNECAAASYAAAQCAADATLSEKQKQCAAATVAVASFVACPQGTDRRRAAHSSSIVCPTAAPAETTTQAAGTQPGGSAEDTTTVTQSTMTFTFADVKFADMSAAEVTAAEDKFTAVFTATTGLVPVSVTAQAAVARRRAAGDLEMVVVLKPGDDGAAAKTKLDTAIAAGTAKVKITVGGTERELNVAAPQVSNAEVPAAGESAATMVTAAGVAVAAAVMTAVAL